MAATVLTTALHGIEASLIDVEADISPGLGSFQIVGLPDAAVQEARERVRSALKHSDLPFPRTKITVNLAPADIRKAGTYFDLPIAIAVLMAHGDLPEVPPRARLLAGELALDGKLRPIPGALSMAMLCAESGIAEIILPQENGVEAALVPNIMVKTARTLKEITDYLCGQGELTLVTRVETPNDESKPTLDMSSIRGQEQAKRALEIAAAGGHNLLMQGPPGSGKTLLARSLPSILPRLTMEEALEVTRIYSVLGSLHTGGMAHERPFRAPHHTASGTALVGGGTIPKPGEISLAHRGVLFLDEFPEFSRSVLENLRQPLEDGQVTIARAQGTVSFPARFLLVAAMNPCPCGFATDRGRNCTCSPMQVEKYKKRISGPLLDRIDLAVEVPRVPTEKLTDLAPGEPSLEIRRRVQAARDIQSERFAGCGIVTNSELSSEEARTRIGLKAEGRAFLKRATEHYRLSARAYFRILKVSRTIADLEKADQVEEKHLAEALQYRQIT